MARCKLGVLSGAMLLVLGPQVQARWQQAQYSQEGVTYKQTISIDGNTLRLSSIGSDAQVSPHFG